MIVNEDIIRSVVRKLLLKEQGKAQIDVGSVSVDYSKTSSSSKTPSSKEYEYEYEESNVVKPSEGVTISGGNVANDLEPKVKEFINAFKAKFPSVKLTSKRRSPADQARVSFQYPYAIDALIRQKLKDIPPGSYYFSKRYRALSSEQKKKINDTLTQLSKEGKGNLKPVSNGVYGENSIRQKIFKIYDEYKDKIKEKGHGAVDQGDLDSIVDATKDLWKEDGGNKPGTHMTGQAVDIAGIELSEKMKEKIKSQFETVKKENDKFKNYKVFVHKESDHFHIGITPG